MKICAHEIARIARSSYSDVRGASAVEFAIISPVLLLIVFATSYVGLLFGIAHGVQSIAAEASRYAVVGLTADEREHLVATWLDERTKGHPLIDPSRLTYQVAESDSWFTVVVSYDTTDLSLPPFAQDVLKNSGALTRSASAVLP